MKLSFEAVEKLITEYTYKTNLKRKDFTVIVSLPKDVKSSLVSRCESLGV